jgi:hypothetical protein
MTFVSLADRLSQLPLILAGPLLRRTESSSVTVWLALKKSGRVKLSIYTGGVGPINNGNGDPSGSTTDGRFMFSGEADTIKIGDNLHLALITAFTLDAPAIDPLDTHLLQPSQIYCYNLEFNNFDGYSVASTLETSDIFGFNGNIQDICYAPFTLPTFSLPPIDLNSLHILHGSCRKPHGGGTDEVDGLSNADDIIASTCESADERPHQFYHTGDQIYADDVASVLLYMLDDAGKSLFGWVESLAALPPPVFDYSTNTENYLTMPFAKEGIKEPLPADPAFNTKSADPKTHFSIQPGRRLQVVQTLAGFSRDVAGDSHLIRFAEYACMYLFAWSDVVWPARPTRASSGSYARDAYKDIDKSLLPSFEQVMPSFRTRAASAAVEQISSSDEASERDKFDIDKQSVIRFLSTLPKVRRVLANVPSYMMCDDHEVTDDWFISDRWCQRVYSLPLGNRIIQNGLAAFAVFQAWGNKPGDFVAGNNMAGSKLLSALSKLATERGQQVGTWLTIRDTVLPYMRINTAKEQGNVDGIPTRELLLNDYRGINNSGVIDYSFCIPFGKFALLAINSRTERGLPVYTVPRIGPALLHPAAMRRQVHDAIQSLPSTVKVLMVLCPAPVIGHSMVEGFLQTKLQRDLDNYMAERMSGMQPPDILTPPRPLPLMGWPFVVRPRLHRDTAYEADPIQPIKGISDEGDREGWAFHPECMQSLLKELSVAQRVILFSGDVHYGFSVGVKYNRPISPDTPDYPEHSAIVQLVCSSFKNADVMTKAAGTIASDFMKRGADYAGWSHPGKHYRDWKYSKVDGLQLEIPDSDRGGDFHFTELTWPSMQILDTPQWQYHIKFSVDGRQLSKRYNYPGSTIFTEYGYSLDALPLDLYHYWKFWLLAEHYIAIGHTQVGQVKLQADVNDKVYNIHHNYWFVLPGVSDTSAPGPITKHEIDIAPDS